MARTSLFPLASTLIALVACSGGDADEQAALTYDETLPSAELSTRDIEFGELDLGESAARTFTLRNGGDLPMGISSLALLESQGLEAAFSLQWDPAELDCPEGTEDPETDGTDGSDGSAEAKGIDSGSTDGSDGPTARRLRRLRRLRRVRRRAPRRPS